MEKNFWNREISKRYESN